MSTLYPRSFAVVIGVNAYQHASPLGFARQDAQAVHRALVDGFGFPATVASLLVDADATAAKIRAALAEVSRVAEEDDRVVIFFAGHGYTHPSRRGEMGFLVPHDGDVRDLATLIAWGDCVRYGDLIRSRHVLFVMDACYGGLAFTRSSRPGSMRFLRDMLRRYARQVLTAGKADEVVADSGGPRVGHSVFTGHLLDALDGAAATTDGVLTANGVMAYVYDRVAKDAHSRQTPHYGHIDGDGDLIFSAPPMVQLPPDTKEGVDILVTVPATLVSQTSSMRDPMDLAKEYLSDAKSRIQLDELITEHLRRAIAQLDPSQLALDVQPINAETVAKRLSAFDAALGDLPSFVALIARWGSREHLPTFTKVFARLADSNSRVGGYEGWIGLRWMPFDSLMYSAGISALCAENYSFLAALYGVRSADRQTGQPAELAFMRAVNGLASSAGDFLKQIPEHQRQFVPRSEYQFKHMQPLLDDLLFLGASYEELFDRFEIFHALAYTAAAEQSHRRGPPGRFAWKHQNYGNSPLTSLLQEGAAAGPAWGPFTAGMFGSSPDRFKQVGEEYAAMIAQLNWY